MTEPQTMLEAFYAGWENYQALIIAALTPITSEQLTLRAAPHLRSVGELATHMVATRAGWFHNAIGEGTDATAGYVGWRREGPPVESAAELIEGLQATWRLMREALARWTPDELAQPFQRDRNGETFTLTRQWIIWHLIEHDLHHGGEISLTLGMHGLEAPDL